MRAWIGAALVAWAGCAGDGTSSTPATTAADTGGAAATDTSGAAPPADTAGAPDTAASAGDGVAPSDSSSAQDAAPGETATPPADTGGGGPDASPGCGASEPRVVTFTTDDGVTLEADLHPPTAPDAGAVVLLHMVPPGNDRTNFPLAFRTLLAQTGLAVLNVDRRGAGGSGGVAKEAYTGPNGRLDVKGAIAYLRALPCPPARIGIVGASNGTTSALDYAALAATDATDPRPAALVFLTGGTYTENQTSLTDSTPLLADTPLLLVYSTAEKAWSAGFVDGAPAAWVFQEYDPGGHGTLMFDIQPGSMTLVADFLGAHL